MRGASRTSFAGLTERLEAENITSATVATRLGDELFAVVGLLDTEHGLRRALSDPGKPAAEKAARTKVEQSMPSRPPRLPRSALAADSIRWTGSTGGGSAGGRAGGGGGSAAGASVASATGMETGSGTGASRCPERDETQAAASASSPETRVRHGFSSRDARIDRPGLQRECQQGNGDYRVRARGTIPHIRRLMSHRPVAYGSDVASRAMRVCAERRGFLDRIDSLLFAGPALYYYYVALLLGSAKSA